MGRCWNAWGWSGGGHMGFIGPIVGGLLVLGFLVLLAVLVIWLVRRPGQRSAVVEMSTEPLEIARRRLAAGEITVEEYEVLREKLQRRT